MGYLPVLINSYGEADDFDVLHDFWETGTHLPTFIGSMRPLGGLLADLTYNTITPEFHNLWIMRLGHVLGVICFCVLFSKALQILNVTKSNACLLALIVGLSPAIQVMVNYSTMMALPLAGMAGILSFICARRALNKKQNRYPFVILSVILLVAGLSIYQIYPMIFWSFVLVEMLQEKRDIKPLFIRLVQYGVIFGVGLVSYYFLCAKIIPDIVGLEKAGRTSLTSNPIHNLIYFIIRPLRDSLNLFSLSYYGPLSRENLMAHIPSYASAITVGSCTIYGILKYFSDRPWSHKITLGIFIFGLITMSYLPNLVTAALYTPYRTQYALFASVLIVIYFAVMAVTPKHVNLLLYVLFGCSFIFCIKHLQFDIIAPRQAEWQLVYNGTKQAIYEENKEIFVVMPDQKLMDTKTTYYSEFGGMVSMSDRGHQMVRVALRELGKNYNEYNIIAERLPSDHVVLSSMYVIDLRSLY